MALSAKDINENTRWQDLTDGLQIYEPATSKNFLTGEWRTNTCIRSGKMQKLSALRTILPGQFHSGKKWKTFRL